MCAKTLLFVIVSSILTVISGKLSSSQALLQLRGGEVGPRQSKDGKDYYDQFNLNYGSGDTERIAGALRGFVKSGSLLNLRENDPFLAYMNKYLEEGPEEMRGRIKPFYAADFGDKSDLRRGEHPQVVIVTRRLEGREDGTLKTLPSNMVDVEVRNIWQPWIKPRCKFAVRYIVPNRKNILGIMDSQGKFTSKLVLKEDEEGRRSVEHLMEFRPRILSRLKGKGTKTLRRSVPTSVLSSGAKSRTAAAAGGSGLKTKAVPRPSKMKGDKEKQKQRQKQKKEEATGDNGSQTASIRGGGQLGQQDKGKHAAMATLAEGWAALDRQVCDARAKLTSLIPKTKTNASE